MIEWRRIKNEGLDTFRLLKIRQNMRLLWLVKHMCKCLMGQLRLRLNSQLLILIEKGLVWSRKIGFVHSLNKESLLTTLLTVQNYYKSARIIKFLRAHNQKVPYLILIRTRFFFIKLLKNPQQTQIHKQPKF